MTQSELKALLKSSGIPFAFRRFKTAQSLPFGVYLTQGETGFKADGMRYSHTTSIRIELYTAKDKSPATEEALENVLDVAGFFYEKTDELYIESENMYEVIYEMEI